jgi:hypothetical protein
MARELSPAEWAALSEDERQARRRAKHQREREALTVHDVALANVLFDLSGRVHVRGRGPATPSEIESILERSPQAHDVLTAIAAARRET